MKGCANMTQWKIEIVDDTPIVRERLRETILGMGNFVIVGEAGTPGDAIAIFERERPDVIILDMRLMGGTGIDVLQAIRKIDTRVCIIVWTNFPYERYRSVSTAMGANHFFWKATEYDKLLETLRAMSSPA